MRIRLGICLLFVLPTFAAAQDDILVPPAPTANNAAEHERLKQWLLERLRAAEGFEQQAYEKAKADLERLSVQQLQNLVQAFRDREREQRPSDRTEVQSEALRRAYSDLESARALRDHLRRRVIQKQAEMPPPIVQFGVPFGAYAYPGFGYGPAYPPIPYGPPVVYGPPFGYGPFYPY